jgi:hypothetical protein
LFVALTLLFKIREKEKLFLFFSQWFFSSFPMITSELCMKPAENRLKTTLQKTPVLYKPRKRQSTYYTQFSTLFSIVFFITGKNYLLKLKNANRWIGRKAARNFLPLDIFCSMFVSIANLADFRFLNRI